MKINKIKVHYMHMWKGQTKKPVILYSKSLKIFVALLVALLLFYVFLLSVGVCPVLHWYSFLGYALPFSSFSCGS
jgi:hypothetical protein